MIKLNQIKLTGTWRQIKYSEAFEGMIGQIFFHYVANKEDGHTFYGIQSINNHDGFNYFIGITDPFGTTIIPEGVYHQSFDTELAFKTYQSLQNKITGKELFDAKLKYDNIPVRIEKYLYKNNQVFLTEILIPLIEA